jgi:uncharacterized protein
MKTRCPICKKSVDYQKDQGSPRPSWLPFCSERCKLIDLGRWLDADYTIPAAPDPDQEEENPADINKDSGEEDV